VVTANDGWEPVQRIRTYEQVMAQIEQRILDGRLKAGDKLPSERELAQSLGVSRPSLREAMRVLEALGLVDIRVGGGPDGGAVLVQTPGDGAANLLKLQIALAHFSWDDVLETRLTLETWSVEEAAYRADDDDHRELAEILDRMDDPTIDSAEFNRLDALLLRRADHRHRSAALLRHPGADRSPRFAARNDGIGIPSCSPSKLLHHCRGMRRPAAPRRPAASRLGAAMAACRGTALARLPRNRPGGAARRTGQSARVDRRHSGGSQESTGPE